MTTALHSLLASLIDYAGLFPPANLPMKDAVENFAGYRVSRESWMLSRFIVPASRLTEFESAASNLAQQEKSSFPWLLTVLPKRDITKEVSAVQEFNKRWLGVWEIDVMELKASTVDEIKKYSVLIPDEWEAYFEIPSTQNIRSLISTIGDVGRRAKIRTGGIRQDLIPSSSQVAAFLEVCVNEKVPFKATAGLHHPIRSSQNLTYEPDSPTGVMHGFMNVFLAAALIRMGASRSEAISLLEDMDPASFSVTADGIGWRTWIITEQTIGALRSEIAVGFGSCSFREPIDDLKSLSMM